MISALLRLVGRKPRAPRKAPNALVLQRMIADLEGRLPQMEEGPQKDEALAKLAELQARLQRETDALRTWA